VTDGRGGDAGLIRDRRQKSGSVDAKKSLGPAYLHLGEKGGRRGRRGRGEPRVGVVRTTHKVEGGEGSGGGKGKARKGADRKGGNPAHEAGERIGRENVEGTRRSGRGLPEPQRRGEQNKQRAVERFGARSFLHGFRARPRRAENGRRWKWC